MIPFRGTEERPVLAFIHINKTAGTTVSHILRSSYGFRHCQVEPWHARWTGPPFSARDLERVRKLYPNLRSIAGHRIVGYVDLEDGRGEVRYFTFIRDPLRSAASRFQYKVQVSKKKDLRFEEWIEQDWTRNHQTKQIAGVADAGAAMRTIREKGIFVGLAERFDESLVLLRSLLAEDLNISYEPVNVARKTTIAKRLLENERTRRLLTESQRVDLELYERVCTELLPTYEAAYGPSLTADVATFRRTQTSGFDRLNLSLARAKHYAVYKPALELGRRGLSLV